MNNLYIHPDDYTTKFLKAVYGYDQENNRVITTGTRQGLIDEIQSKANDRVIMMGHGTQGGLLSVGQFDGREVYALDSAAVPSLKERDNNVFIWCNADLFVERHDLKGFYTGMFISEVGEAVLCGIKDLRWGQIENSNNMFADEVHCALEWGLDSHEMLAHLKDTYCKDAPYNEIIKYNSERLYAR